MKCWVSLSCYHLLKGNLSKSWSHYEIHPENCKRQRCLCKTLPIFQVQIHRKNSKGSVITSLVVFQGHHVSHAMCSRIRLLCIISTVFARLESAFGNFGWREDENGLYAELQLASMPFEKNFGHLKHPPKRFWIEIGAHFLSRIPDEDLGEDDFLISFEPLLHKYAMLLSSGNQDPKHRQALGLSQERRMILPFAVGCTTSRVTSFGVSEMDYCSSMLATQDPDKIRSSLHSCLRIAEQRQVPCISLEHIIQTWLSEKDIYYLKVDAQGMDLEIMRSAGSMISKIKKVQLEAACDTSPQTYPAAPNCSTVWNYMTRSGFTCDWIGGIYFPEQRLECRHVKTPCHTCFPWSEYGLLT